MAVGSSWLISAVAGAAVLALLRGVRASSSPPLELLVPGRTGEALRRHRLASMSARLGRSRVGGSRSKNEATSKRLRLAGDPATLDVFAGTKLALAIGVVTISLGSAFLVPVAALLGPVLALTAYRVPDVLLDRGIRRRQQLIDAHVPDLVEMLLAMTTAGSSPLLAFQRSAEILTGPLGTELRSVARRVELGLPWQEGLRQLVEVTGVPSLGRLAGALARSGRLGTHMGSALRSVADDLRGERRARAEEQARRAPVKMLFPLVLLVLPAFLLLTVGPVVLATIRSLR